MQECEFCENLDAWKKNTRARKIKYEYGCMLYVYRKFMKGSITSRPFDLNYCPECGKKMTAGD